ncbi:hypothetical protein [Paraburkholderia sp. 35.1]|uniref:hypothetical protein n=1 Tax=Paraburkholderia sp. 35.1 TaxID=2991058 RepID=UPI003D1A9C46
MGASTMGRFFRRPDENGKDRWWLEVMGEGGKERLVRATAEMMTELGRYRLARGLPALPSPGEDMPLVLPVGQSLEPLTPADLHRIMKDVFGGTDEALRAWRKTCAARRSSRAGIGYTGCVPAPGHGSHMADQQVDLRLVRHNLGHASLTKTSRYMHIDEDRQRSETDENIVLTGNGRRY